MRWKSLSLFLISAVLLIDADGYCGRFNQSNARAGEVASQANRNREAAGVGLSKRLEA